MIPGADEGIVRELQIYDRFKANPGIPKVISVEKYGEELVVIEEFIKGEDLSKIPIIIDKEYLLKTTFALWDQ